MKKRSGRISRRLSRMFELPCEVFGGVSSVTLTSNAEMLIDGCTGIEEYESDRVRLVLCDQDLEVVGCDLRLNSFFGRQILICGRISEVRLT
ncbi:MAG: hypothetical protein IJC50_04655 [Clostridia bacterium]|nr:hypothetical protein [Clostridia bacterium]